MKQHFVRRILAIGLCLCALLVGTACEAKPSEGKTSPLSYEQIHVSDYLRLGDYTGLTVTVQKGEARGAAAWRTVIAGCELAGYPEEAVAYYVAQGEARCRYYAKTNGVSYEEAMTALGLTAETIRAEAEALVAADLAYRAVREAADITLTDEEKATHFDRYVDKYVSDWGYDRDYVVKNLSTLVYDSMLYDKTTEYLIVHNTFAEET